jgi:three-Cys-motif partner protein
MMHRMENAATPLIPTAYDGREQALVKHRLLEDYLEKLFLIIGMGSKNGGGSIELCYVDCFAGPWGDPSEDMQSTSIAISLKTLGTCRQKLASMRVYVKIRALYVEAKPTSFRRLETYLATGTPRSIKSHCMQGDFVSLRQQILDWAGPDAFTFFFIDPMGYTEIAVPTLAPLVRRQRSEFLINLMYEHANRAMSMESMRERMATVLGEDLDVTGLTPKEREYAFVHTYRKSLKRCVPVSTSRPARAAHARVMNPERDRTKYHLVYVTSHPKGVVEFMDISEKADRLQSKVRAVLRDQKKAANEHNDELWAPGTMVDFDAGHASASEVNSYWQKLLSGGDRTINMAAFADILEETDWFEGDLQASLVRLIKAGKVVNRTADASRRYKRPLHYEDDGGETLGWIGAASLF